MDKAKCELCPISTYCPAHKEARKDNESSYHPQEIVRVWIHDCPLVKLISE